MSRITLQRYANIPGMGVYGTIKIGDREVFTCEREWLNNQPNISCIPSGLYGLEPHQFRGRLKTHALVGETVSHYPVEGVARFAVVIHPANIPSQLEGCIAAGTGRFWFQGQLAVSSSVVGTAALIQYINEKKIREIEIKNPVRWE